MFLNNILWAFNAILLYSQVPAAKSLLVQSMCPSPSCMDARTVVGSVQKMKNLHHFPFDFSLTWSNIKQVASMCQIAKLQVAKSLMPRSLSPSSRCQVPVPSVPSLCLLVGENSRLKATSLLKLSFFWSLQSLPSCPTTPSLPFSNRHVLGSLGVSNFFISQVNPKLNMSVFFLSHFLLTLFVMASLAT